MAVIAGRAADGAFVQAISQDGSYRADFPVSVCRKDGLLQIGDNRFSKDGISLCIRNKNLELTGDLRYAQLTPIRTNIMGPFRFFHMQCTHTVISMSHSVAGSIRLNGTEYDFTGGRGYIEGDSGRSFPKSYTWVQCNDFEDDCSIMASAADIPFGFTRFWGCICVVWLRGVEYRLATYHGARILHRDEGQLVVVQKDLSLRVRFLQPPCGHQLAAPLRGKMTRSIREVPSAPAYFEFRRGDQLLFQGQSQCASYEYVV